MDQDGLDKFIKDQVEQHKTNTDADLLWQKIQAKQDAKKKKKRRFFIFWLFGGLGLFLGLALLYIFQFSDRENSRQEGNLQTETNTTEMTSSVVKKQENEANLTEQNIDEQASSLTTKTNIEKESNSQQILDATTVKAKGASGLLTNKNTSNTDFDKAQTPIFTKNSSATNTNPPAPIDNTNQLSKTIDNPNDLLTDSKDEKTEDTNIKDKDEEGDILDNSISDVSPEPNGEELLISDSTAVSEIEEIIEETTKEEDSREEQDDSKEKQWYFSNGITFFYGKTFRTLSSSTNLEYLQTRANTETPLDAIRGNLDFMMQNSKGFYMKAGLEFEQINERLDAYIERDSVQVEDNQVLALVYAMNGSASQRLGNGEVVTTYWSQKTIYNRYRSIDIPVLIGYNVRKEDKKLGWFVEGGASVNLWFAGKGQIFDSNNNLISLEDNPELFKSQTGISLLANAGLTYQVSNKFSIWASPSIKYRLASIASDENSLEQKYLNAGLNLGIRYHWEK